MAILTEYDLLENWRPIPKQWEAWFVEQKQYCGTINSPHYTIRVTTPGANLTMPIGESETEQIDLIISKAQKEISAIKEYRESLITDLVTGKRCLPNDLG